MRRGSAPVLRGLLGLALLVVTGCLLPADQRVRVTERLKLTGTAPTADGIVIDVAVIETAPGDRLVDSGVWVSADEGVVSIDQKARLEDNGLRVGVFGGLTRATLQELLDSPRSNPEPHRIQMRPGTVKSLKVGDPRPNLRFTLQADGSAKEIALEQAECSLQVTPTAVPQGVRLHFEPQITHGNQAPWPRLTETGSLSLAAQKPTERYKPLEFDLVLQETEYAVIGTRFDRIGSLGREFFTGFSGEKPVQRLLVLRARRAGNSSAEEKADATAGSPLD